MSGQRTTIATLTAQCCLTVCIAFMLLGAGCQPSNENADAATARKNSSSNDSLTSDSATAKAEPQSTQETGQKVGASDAPVTSSPQPPVEPKTTTTVDQRQQDTTSRTVVADASDKIDNAIGSVADAEPGDSGVQGGGQTQIIKAIPRAGSVDFVDLEKPTDSVKLRKEALALAEFLTGKYPSVTDAYELRARMHLLLGQRENAKANWLKALEIDPTYPYAQQGLGRLALVSNEMDQAVQYLERAVQDLAQLPEVNHDLAAAYLKLGEVAKAIEVLEKQAERDPSSADTQLQLGHALLADKKYEAARTAFEKTLELAESPRALEGLGRALVRLGEREKAREMLVRQKAARDLEKTETPEEVFAQELTEYAYQYAEIAKLLLADGQLQDAERVLRKAVAMDPANMGAWTNLISIPQSRDRFVDAAELAKRMVEANPDTAGVYFTYGLLLVKARDLKGAIENLTKATELAPQDHKAFETLARLLVQNRAELAQSIVFADKAVELRGAAADYELLAQAYALNGKMQSAKSNLEKAVELEPQNQMYRQALEQLSAFLASQKKP